MQMPACTAFVTSRRLGGSSTRQPRAAARRLVLAEAKGKKVMIVNTKKGGHAFLGLYLAKRLLGKGFGVTIFNDGDPVRLTILETVSHYDPTRPRTLTSVANDMFRDSPGKILQSLEEKDPFSQYAVVAKNNPPPRGLQIQYGSPTDPSTYPEGSFDVIVDNNGKSMAECQPLIDTYANEVRPCSHPLPLPVNACDVPLP